MKKCFLCLLFLLSAALPGRCDGIDSWFAGLDTTAFLLVDKQKLTLTLVAPGGRIERDYRIACGENFGNKTQKGDHRTPEGRFPINQLLNAAGLSHDFGDGKGSGKYTNFPPVPLIFFQILRFRSFASLRMTGGCSG